MTFCLHCSIVHCLFKQSKWVRAFYWIITAWMIMFQLTSYVTLTDAVRSIPFSKQPWWKKHLMVLEKRGQTFVMHQSKKADKEIDKPTKIRSNASLETGSIVLDIFAEERKYWMIGDRWNVWWNHIVKNQQLNSQAV